MMKPASEGFRSFTPETLFTDAYTSRDEFSGFVKETT